MQMVFYLDTKSVNFVYGTIKYSENIHGIPCHNKLIPDSLIEHDNKMVSTT